MNRILKTWLTFPYMPLVELVKWALSERTRRELLESP